ncbi:unnamed protein product [Calypogeia fissa]
MGGCALEGDHQIVQLTMGGWRIFVGAHQEFPQHERQGAENGDERKEALVFAVYVAKANMLGKVPIME